MKTMESVIRIGRRRALAPYGADTLGIRLEGEKEWAAAG
jgi:hypothetical protein